MQERPEQVEQRHGRRALALAGEVEPAGDRAGEQLDAVRGLVRPAPLIAGDDEHLELLAGGGEEGAAESERPCSVTSQRLSGEASDASQAAP